MLARAHVSGSGTPSGEPGPSADTLAFAFLRYLDVVLVLASVPFVLIADMPRLGFAIGAAGWIVIRFGADFLKRRAWAAGSTGTRAGLHLAAILGRVWLIALVLLAARFGGGSSDGVTAAVVVLAAFTVELAMSFVLRGALVSEAGRSR
jgi:hypothetical protein